MVRVACCRTGLPPTWARQKDALAVMGRAHEARYGFDVTPSQVCA